MYSRIKNKDVRNLVNYIYEDVSNPRILSGIAGGFMVNAGLIMTLSGVFEKNIINHPIPMQD